MKITTTVLFLAITLTAGQTNDTSPAEELSNVYFPENFLFGTASSAYQIEGAWNQHGKGENIWDRYLHEHPDYVRDRSNGDVACDSYNKWAEDIDLLEELGVNMYRFSISWARILPNGKPSSLNLLGVAHYLKILIALKLKNIEPVVTLYHWDLPQALQDQGGILSPNFPTWFGNYARVCFSLFGAIVKYWITFNEGSSFCIPTLLSPNVTAPGTNNPGIYEYQCGRSVLLAHAKAWHIYNNEFRFWFKGNVGMVIVSHWFQPATNSTEDQAAAERILQFLFGWWAHPLIYGDYPQIMKDTIARRSAQQGFSKSRLPEFSTKEIAYIVGTLDFLGLNIYTAAVAQPANSTDLGFLADVEALFYQLPEWPDSGLPGLKVAPWSIREITKWIKKNYKNPKTIITECGYGSIEKTLQDSQRTLYIQTYLSNLRKGMIEDGSNVIGFNYWSFLDTFEWFAGYSENFGIVYVDFNSTDRTRTFKDSAKYYAKVCKSRCLKNKCIKQSK